MTPGKRLFDLALALMAGGLLLPLGLGIAAAIRLRDGAPVFYAAERMRTPGRAFTLWKFRTMRPDRGDSGVTGADKSGRITTTGRWLRRFRLDELPQLWNILRGDLSFVGPRPPLRQYVEAAPELYARVLAARPGLTGLATLHYHAVESRLLSRCRSRAETHAVYLRRCVPRKAHLDLIYLAHRSVCFDVQILAQTVARVLRRNG